VSRGICSGILDWFATPGTILTTISPFSMTGQTVPGQLRLHTDVTTVSLGISAVGTRSGTVTFRLYGYNPATGHSTAPLGLGLGSGL
jgi:hypothetical protein